MSVFTEIGIHQSSVLHIIHDDLDLKCLEKHQPTPTNRAVRMQRSEKLLEMYPENKVNFAWLTCE